MRIAVLGRTHWLISVVRQLLADGHEVALVATAPAPPEYAAGQDAFAQLAAETEAPYLFDPDVNHDNFREALVQSGAQIGISINWPTMIRRQTCEALTHGILNGHAGDLPRYRGNACPNWAIINGENHVGLCVHTMDPDMVDAGDIYVRSKLLLDDVVYISDVYAWMENVLPDMFADALERVEDPSFAPERQDASGVLPLRCHPRRPEDGLINWGHSAENIARLVRASSRPLAGAFSYLEARTKLTVWRGREVELDHDILAVPGQIVGRGPGDGVLVACGSGVIEIEEAELADGATLSYANRFRLMDKTADTQ